MNITFDKYHGTGNDFIIVDNRQQVFTKNDTKLIAGLCHRRFGIGADGLILLENHPELDFRMVYYNADGWESSMCGNGGRCLVHFAKRLGLVEEKAEFEAIDGRHTATVVKEKIISLSMQDVDGVSEKEGYLFLDTGSPHHVEFCDGIEDMDLWTEGAARRYKLYGKTGANINFVSQKKADNFAVRTYERGVEAETLSCGTGAVAVAVAAHHAGLTKSNDIHIETPGGALSVRFEPVGKGIYKNIFLTGPVVSVFEGTFAGCGVRDKEENDRR